MPVDLFDSLIRGEHYMGWWPNTLLSNEMKGKTNHVALYCI
jgi:hypothetical protein